MYVAICIINEVPLKLDQRVLPCFTRLLLFKSATLFFCFLIRCGASEIRGGGGGGGEGGASALTFMCDHLASPFNLTSVLVPQLETLHMTN